MNAPTDSRSLSHWAHVARDPSRYAALSPDERRWLGECLRDRFFALAAPDRDAAEERAFRELVDAVDAPPVARIEGLAVAFHPTARFKAVRFVDAERIDAAHRPLFARASAEAPHLAAVFVDPAEYSFRTFENIVPLDRILARAPLELTLRDRVRLDKKIDAYAFTVAAPDAARDALARLDALDLYVAPLNAASRGGKRFIFHSAALAEALTRAVREAMPRSLLGGFSHVNPVFRCNRFEPGEEKFHSHFDTPYYDAARNHVSRYTVLLYLTGGTGAPALRIADDVALESIAPMTCVVFDQRHEHEGASYDDGRKVFLRTELIFEDASITHAPGIAELFSKACYLTGESVFAPELARHANDYYNRVAEAHWRGGLDDDGAGDAAAKGKRAKPEPFVHKQFRGVHFVANGYDFWFPKRAVSLKEAAALTLLDYFNCTVGETAFRKQCASKVVSKPPRGAAWVPEYLAPYNAPLAEPLFAPLDKDALFPQAEASDGVCCPFHGFERFDASRHAEIVDLYERAQTFARKRILPAPVLTMGEEVFLDPEKFVVEGDKVHVLSDKALTPVNFAACWNSGGLPPMYIEVEATVGLLQPLVPPILFVETGDCYHLMFDFFRNSWMVDHRQVRVPVPRIHDGVRDYDDTGAYDEDAEQSSWMAAVDPKIVEAPQGNGRGNTWWAGSSPLERELYAQPGRRRLPYDE